MNVENREEQSLRGQKETMRHAENENGRGNKKENRSKRIGDDRAEL